jgi:predicted metal-dependent hydrolase
MTPIRIIRRVHPRARRLKLTFRAGQFWLTIPPRCSERSIQAFLTQSREWCVAQLAQQHQTSASSCDTLDVRLPCLDQVWQHTDGQWIEQQTGIVVQFATPQDQQQWLVQHATPYLTQRLAELAAQHRLVYSHCRVSRMRSRWGSCNASAKIHLNAGLLFLDSIQLDYVLLHELCHTKQMNHSPAFWQDVARVCPDFAQIRGSLKQVRLPTWWLA